MPQVDTSEWLKPASEEKLHTLIQTPGGDFELYRLPALRKSVQAKAESWEKWRLSFGGADVLVVEDAAAPWVSLHKRMRAGIHGRLEGDILKGFARRSLLPSRRIVEFTVGDSSLKFEVKGLSVNLIRENSDGGRHLIARTRRGRWQSDGLDQQEMAVACLYSAAGLDVFLESPLWDIPLF